MYYFSTIALVPMAFTSGSIPSPQFNHEAAIDTGQVRNSTSLHDPILGPIGSYDLQTTEFGPMCNEEFPFAGVDWLTVPFKWGAVTTVNHKVVGKLPFLAVLVVERCVV